MTEDDLREAIHREKVQLSFVECNTGIPHERLGEFLDGNDQILNASELQAVEELLCPNEQAQRHNEATNNAVHDGVGDALQRHSLAFVFQSRQDKPELASGTLVKIGDSILVATAGHVVDQTTTLQFVGENRIDFRCDFTPEKGFHNVGGGSNVAVLRWGRHAMYDVGLFELDESAPSKLEREPIDITRISIAQPQYGRTAFVYGYPSEFVKARLMGGRDGYLLPVGTISYPQLVMAPYEWPQLPDTARPAQEDVDCFVRYSRTDEMIKVAPRNRHGFPPPPDLPDTLPSAVGMSGGGFWQNFKPSEQRLWSTDSYRLIAIQSAWFEGAEYLRAIQA